MAKCIFSYFFFSSFLGVILNRKPAFVQHAFVVEVLDRDKHLDLPSFGHLPRSRGLRNSWHDADCLWRGVKFAVSNRAMS